TGASVNFTDHVLNTHVLNPPVSVSSSVPLDDGLLALVPGWFKQLSNGGSWKPDRDEETLSGLRGINKWHILLGLCYSISRSPEHKMSSLKYAVDAIERHAKDMAEFPDNVLAEIAYKTKLKTLNCIATGNWTVAEWEIGRE